MMDDPTEDHEGDSGEGHLHHHGGCTGRRQPEHIVNIIHEMESGLISHNDSVVTPGVATPTTTIPSGVETPSRRRKLTDFIIEGDLGEGAHSFVKKGRLRNPPAGQDAAPLAIKMVIKSKLLPECILHDFESGLSLPIELFVLRHLRDLPHPSIVAMDDAFEDKQYYYIIMTIHGQGEDLFEIIERNQDFLPVDRVERIFAQVAMAIEHLHCHLGVVHRDIKDENIIIDEHDRIQLIDFGSCAYYRQGGPAVQEDVPWTEADIRMGRRFKEFLSFHGTVDYAPPEVVRGEPHDGPPQDMWAMGVLLYTLCFKESPFHSVSEILECKLRIPFEPTKEIVETIQRLLDPDPRKRMTAAELASLPWIQRALSQQHCYHHN